MASTYVGGRPTRERRQRPRVKLSVPVACSSVGTAGRSRELLCSGSSRDLSTGGVYAVLPCSGMVAPGQTVALAIEVPWEARGAFPFSRIAGTGRVVRLEPLGGPDHEGMSGAAIAFCGDVTLLGTIMKR